MELMFEASIGRGIILLILRWLLLDVRLPSLLPPFDCGTHSQLATLVIPWTLGRYAAKGFARTFSGRARLPSIERMWASYPGAGKELRDMHGFEECTSRPVLV